MFRRWPECTLWSYARPLHECWRGRCGAVRVLAGEPVMLGRHSTARQHSIGMCWHRGSTWRLRLAGACWVLHQSWGRRPSAGGCEDLERAGRPGGRGGSARPGGAPFDEGGGRGRGRGSDKTNPVKLEAVSCRGPIRIYGRFPNCRGALPRNGATAREGARVDWWTT
jgi:hypothetical protein